jgi:hypothetical protein
MLAPELTTSMRYFSARRSARMRDASELPATATMMFGLILGYLFLNTSNTRS